jgi:hypothetical protein
VGWNLSLNSASVFGSFVLFNNGISANSTFQNQAGGIGGFFSATATKLLFDFSNGAGSYFQGINVANPLQPQFVWCLQAGSNTCAAGAPGEWLSVENLANPPPPQFVAMSGLQVIGTAATPSIPEPSTLALLGAGIALLGFFGLLRRGSRQIKIW